MRLTIRFLALAGIARIASAAVIPETPSPRGPVKRSGPTSSCTTFKVPIKASAQNTVINFPPNYDATSNPIGQLTNSLAAGGEAILGNVLGDLILTEGTYNINMQYCAPEVKNPYASRAETLQFLVHPATHAIAYWSWPVRPETYSWTDYMSKLGYPTLAIDRLGAGLSDHPDPVTEVQANLQTNIHHIIVQMARAGTIPHTNTAFKKVILVGGSYGSILGNQQAIQYPDDLDALLLTGYTHDDQLLVPIFSIQAIAAPAAIVDASHWAMLPLPYLTSTGDFGRGYLYNGPASYDQDIFDYDVENRGTITVGEALTANAGTAVAPNFKGQVHLIVGAEDSVFCGTGISDAMGIVRQGDCTPNGMNIPAMSKSYFPAASSFSYTIIPDTGHVTVLHKTVQQTFASAANFLAASGY